jgi:hypothetical protein
MATMAVFIALGGTAWAAATINSVDVVDDSLKSVDLKDVKGVKGADVVPDSLGGAAIDESTLQNVDARTVSDLRVRKIDFQVPHGTGPTTVLDLAGLQITAECQTFGDDLDVKAFSSKDNASVYYSAGNTDNANDADNFQDIDSDQRSDGRFDIGSPLEIENASPRFGDNTMGTLNYSAPDGSVVVAHLALDEVYSEEDVQLGCNLTGIAIGG